jgi:hydroxymethylglutaryl-CoA synthase
MRACRGQFGHFLKEGHLIAGIVSYGIYVPLRRLGPETRGWNLPTEKAVANWDEDSLTMAVAAAAGCLCNTDRRSVDGLFFTSTTSPYREKLTATTAAWALDLRPEIITADFADSLRSGTTALRMAADTIKAGSAKRLLVTASDLRLGQPRGSQDHGLGDGAAAFLMGDTDVAAALESAYSLNNELLDVWRAERAKYIRTWEDRFVFEEGYLKVLPEAVNNLLKKSGLEKKEISKAVFYAPDARRHREMANRLGLLPSQVQGPFFDQLGNTGSAFSLMMLAAALENAAPGENILLASYGDGADVFLLRTTDKINSIRPLRGLKYYLASKMIIPGYDDYLAFREFAALDPENPFGASASVIHRERDAIYRLQGVRCRVCGTPQYPPQRVCTQCQAKDNFDPYRFSDKKGKVFTYTLKYGGDIPAFARPMVDTMVDFEGGGRALFGMTDMDIKQIKVGMEVEMSFRTLGSGGGIQNYFWRCMPSRDTWPLSGGREAK